MSGDILIFGGTFEGRVIAEALSRAGICAHVFTATEYGGSLIETLPHLVVHSQRLDAWQMQDFMIKNRIKRVVDATHPYAREVTANIVQAAHGANVEYIRVVRDGMVPFVPCGPNDDFLQRATFDENPCCGKISRQTMPGCYGINDAAVANDAAVDVLGNGTDKMRPNHNGLGEAHHGELGPAENHEVKEKFGENLLKDTDKAAPVLKRDTYPPQGSAETTLGKNLPLGKKILEQPRARRYLQEQPLSGQMTWEQRVKGHGGVHVLEAAITRVGNSAEAVSYLRLTQGPVLVTTGSKELDVFCTLPEFAERLYVRVLPMPDVVGRCYDLGLRGAHVIAMQGPFSYELNLALLRHYGCRYLVTKNTGKVGGMEEKIAAALDANVEVVLIERPVVETGLNLRETLFVLGLSEGKEKKRLG